MEKWQTMFSAPRDGSKLLMYIPAKLVGGGKKAHWRSSAIMIGRWVVPTSEEMSAHKHNLYMKHDGYWTAGFSGMKPIRGCPTHWMELPEPPKEGDNGTI